MLSFRHPFAFGLASGLLLALVAVAHADSEMEKKRAAEVGLQPGATLNKETASLAEGLMPAEILEFYKKGDYSNQIGEWPNGIYKVDEEFAKASEENAANLDVNADGLMVDKRTGKYPDYVYGYPFPKIDTNDPKAATKIAWNVLYVIYSHLTSSRFHVNLAFLNRDSVDRVLKLQVFYNYWDAQRKKYIPKNPSNFLQQYIAAAESPQDVYGTTNLTWRFKGEKRDLLWAYVPALRRIRSVSPSNRSDGFLGSDITQDDGPFFDGKPTEFEWKLVGDGEMLRLADPYSLKEDYKREVRPDGSVRTYIQDVQIYGAEDPKWNGVTWAPVAPVLVRRPVWIIEATPKDKYYLYGKIQLVVDKEMFQGLYNRKFSWQGELLQDYIPTGLKTAPYKTEDGYTEYLWGGQVTYFSGLNFKNDRATNVN
ncbi:MAG: DUF1329 domain-containing protein, partial [Candidatus Binatia bacterium]